MERFRRGFYLELATGEGGTFGARRIGGLFGGSGLEGFTGVGGGFGGVGSFFAGAGGADAAGEALQVGGFLGLLQNRQNIRNQQSNIAGLRSNVMQFEQTLNENLQTIPEDPTELVRNRLQVAQARQTLYDQEFALVSAQSQYQARLDNYKVELGLPPTLCVEIADPMLDQFNLLDPRDHCPSKTNWQICGSLSVRSTIGFWRQLEYRDVNGQTHTNHPLVGKQWSKICNGWKHTSPGIQVAATGAQHASASVRSTKIFSDWTRYCRFVGGRSRD